MPPRTGILTRTLVPSSVIRLILPARIRHKDKNDVVFIRDNSIEIKEFIVDEDRLQDVTWKGDFGGTIRTAKVIGMPRKAVPRAIPTGIDAIIKQAGEEDSPEPMETDEVQPLEVPPQILVMVLQSDNKDTLIFLFATQDRSTQTQFLCHRQELPSPQSASREKSCYKHLGSHLAVDPK